jgi:hypothetical protein
LREIASAPGRLHDDAEDEYEAGLDAAYDRTMARFSATRLRMRHRIVLFVFLAFALVVLPFLVLYGFEGMEEQERGVGSVRPGEHDEMGEDHDVSMVDVSMTPSVPVMSASTTASSSLSSSPTFAASLPSHVVRPDLPVRQLVQYVNPLIGTAGKGHGTLHPST